MSPEDVPAEWVEKALNTRLPSGGLPTLNEPQMRAILAAVLPLAQAAARKEEPCLVEWATEVDALGTKEVWDSEAEARAEAKRHGQRLFRVEWVEVDRDA